MGYKVIYRFSDLQDFRHIYNVGDIFPRHGVNVKQSRIDELASKNNKIGKPLIEKIDKKSKDDFLKCESIPEEEKINYTKTEINRMTTADLKELASKNGLDNSLSGAELKKLLIEYFDL